jgi:hypothetical protein
MTKSEFLTMMKFPIEWEKWGLYPDELFMEQSRRYEAGDEEASEHDRNGAFHWWLRQKPNVSILQKLISLTYLDPDGLMSEDARKYIQKAIDETESG